MNSEEDVFSAMEKWVQFDCSKRRTFVTQLLENIRLPLMNCKLLADHVEKSPTFTLSERGKEFLLEAMKYHLLPERRAQMQNPRTKPRKSNVGLLYVVGGLCVYIIIAGLSPVEVEFTLCLIMTILPQGWSHTKEIEI